MRRSTLVLTILALGWSAGCGSRDDRAAAPAGPDALLAPQAPQDLPILDPLEGTPFEMGRIVVRIGDGYTLEEFNTWWGTSTVALVEGTSFAEVTLPDPGADPHDYIEAMTGWDGCDVAEPVFELESPESQQGTIPFFEGTATEETVMGQDAMSRIGADAAHALATGTGVIVGIVDTGIDFTHPDLSAHVATISRDFVDGDDDAMDEVAGLDSDGDGVPDEAAGHGTHVAGLVHAVAPDATLLAVRVLDSEGGGTSVAVARGILWAAEHGARVINLSLGMYTDAAVIREAVKDAENEHDVLVIGAAGNAGRNDRDHFPSRLSRVICVASTDPWDRKATFSNFGPRVAVGAPGVGLVSPWLDHGYASWSGTSMSTPLVAGAVALRLQLYPGTSVSDLRNLLEERSAALPPGYVWSDRMGGGLLQLPALLQP